MEPRMSACQLCLLRASATKCGICTSPFFLPSLSPVLVEGNSKHTVVLEPLQRGGGGGQISYSLYLRQPRLANVFPVNTGLHNNLFRLDSGVGRENLPTFCAR